MKWIFCPNESLYLLERLWILCKLQLSIMIHAHACRVPFEQSLYNASITTSSAHPSNSLTLFWKKISVSMISERILKKDIIDLISSTRIFDILSLSMLKEAENSLVFIKIYRSQWNVKSSSYKYSLDRESRFRIFFLTATTECFS